MSRSWVDDGSGENADSDGRLSGYFSDVGARRALDGRNAVAPLESLEVKLEIPRLLQALLEPGGAMISSRSCAPGSSTATVRFSPAAA